MILWKTPACPGPKFFKGERPPSVLNLGYADDNVVGYDHPQVLVFRNVEGLSESRILDSLVRRPVAQANTASPGLMLSDDEKASQRGGGTWSRIVDRDSWTNRLPVLAWLLAVEMVYLVSLPLAMFIFRPLADRGIILARILGAIRRRLSSLDHCQPGVGGLLPRRHFLGVPGLGAGFGASAGGPVE